MGKYAHVNSALFGITYKNVKFKHLVLFSICASPVINLQLFYIFRANAEFFQYLRPESLLEVMAFEAHKDIHSVAYLRRILKDMTAFYISVSSPGHTCLRHCRNADPGGSSRDRLILFHCISCTSGSSCQECYKTSLLVLHKYLKTV